jgi:predicted acylesterase/phospholipase RssA
VNWIKGLLLGDIPVFEASKHDENFLCDGGLLNNVPAQDLENFARQLSE